MYSLSANLCVDGQDYVYNWDGGDFESYDEAYKKWVAWGPDMNEVREMCIEMIEDGVEELSIQTGIWDEDGNDLQFEEEIIYEDGDDVEEFLS